MATISTTRVERKAAANAESHAHEVLAILGREIGYVPNQWFCSDAALDYLDRLLEDGLPQPERCGSTIPSRTRGSDVSPTLLRMCQEPLLLAEEERELFKIMNLAKFRANQLRSTLDPKRRQWCRVENIKRLLQLAQSAQDRIALANGRLVWSIASPLVSELHTLDNLISEGLIALARAVEKFDFDRGYRFSTYTTLVVRRHLYRFLGDDQKHRSRYQPGATEVFDTMTDYRDSYRITESEWREISHVTDDLLKCLDPRERLIIRERFGLETRGQTRSLQNIADEIGVCKERVRQLEQRALGKMRQVADSPFVAELAFP